jgi:hypothetical protein
MINKNYAEHGFGASSFPDWMRSAFKARTVSDEIKARTGQYLKEHKDMPSDDAEAIFRDIFQKPEPEPLPELYYDSNKTSFWARNDRGNWMTINTSDVKRRLKELGYGIRTSDAQKISEVDSLITAIQNTRDVDYAGPLAGYETGVYMIHGKRVLVRDSPQMIDPVEGDFPMIAKLLNGMLGIEQRKYLDGWLKTAIECLYDRQHRPGQALVLAGPPASGKSLLQQLITKALGGRAGKPYRYMTKGTAFNGELFGCEHLMLEDEMASTDIRARRDFGAKIKEITANRDQSAHGKQVQAITLTPFWRLSISVNSEPENLMILPPIDEHLSDKFIILKVEKQEMPMRTGSNSERQTFWNTLMKELPCYLNELLESDIPAEYASERYGIKHFLHPEIMDTICKLAPEFKLLEMIDAAGIVKWTGRARELRQRLFDCPVTKRDAERLLDYMDNCATYLGRLKTKFPQCFDYAHKRLGGIWQIDLESLEL